MARRFTAVLTLAFAVTLPSCTDLISSPNEVTVILPPAAELLGIIRGVDDSFSRVSSVLGDGAQASKLRLELAALNIALNATDATAADEALTRARTALTDYRAQEMGPGDAPDADVIDLALLVTGNAMRRPCATVVVQAAGASKSKCS